MTKAFSLVENGEEETPKSVVEYQREYSKVAARFCIKNKRKIAETRVEPQWRDLFMDAETFVIDVDSWLQDNNTAADIEATWRDMQELGISKPPYKNFIVHGIATAAPVSVFFMFEDDLETYTFQLVFGGLNKNGVEKANAKYSEEAASGGTIAQGLASAFLMQLCVLLATENVVVERRTSHTVLNRFKNGSGGITYIKAPTASKDVEKHELGSTCRPHLRRGHIRRQHYGEGNALVKKIWVPPCFVNGTPETKRLAYVQASAFQSFN